MPVPSRRRFLGTCARAGLAWPASSLLDGRLSAQERPAPSPSPRPGPGGRQRSLVERFPDLRRHFVFEYYPWYGGAPEYIHWSEAERVPPYDLASNYYPRLGAYDSLSRADLERHARWIAESGVGAINVSWWGPGSYEDRAVPLLMDVMRDHDIKVTFHLEPYAPDRGARFASDVLYLLREYGEKRRWDALLILEDAEGRSGPVFKGFATILGPQSTDCHGVVRPVPEFTRDDVWRRANDGLRDLLRRDFDHVTLLADSADFARVSASGFDGLALYDPFVRPPLYAAYAGGASAAGLVFSFSVNPGFDALQLRRVEPGSCYVPAPFEPPADPPIDWSRAEERERAARIGLARIEESFRATVEVQSADSLLDVQRGFFLVYITSFNEWHEGTQLEPMKDAAELTSQERAIAYHNPARGDARLGTLSALVRSVLQPARRDASGAVAA